jgi:IS4 transposase
VTNLDAGEFPAEEIAALYRLRWEVELLFKELKSAYRFDQVPTKKPERARCLILAALLSLHLGRVLAEIATQRGNSALRSLSPRRDAAVFAQHALDIGRVLLEGNAQRTGRVLAHVADVCTVVARAARPRGGEVALVS